MYSTDLVFFLLSAASGLLYAYFAIDRRGETAERRGAVSFWRDIFVIFLAVFVFRGFFFDWFTIPSNSMQPTLRVGDYVLVEKNRYGFRMPVWHWRLSAGEPPARGDIVVFRKPGDEIYFVKRIIALPGDKLSYYDGVFYINDRRIPARDEEEIYSYPGGSGGLYRERLPDGGWYHILQEDDGRRAGVAQTPDDNCSLLRLPSGRVLNCHLPDGYYFVAGDNRDHSNDSRYWGLLPESHLIGPAVRVIYNFSSDDSRAGLSLRPSSQPFAEPAKVQTEDADNDNNNNNDETEKAEY